MTKKDYELIAEAIHRSAIVASLEGNAIKRTAKHSTIRLVATDLSATLGHNNPKFDRERFLTACGVEV